VRRSFTCHEQKKLEEETWLRENRAANEAALEAMRSFLPPDLWRSSYSTLRGSEGVTEALAKRVWNTKVRGARTGAMGDGSGVPQVGCAPRWPNPIMT
jgi:hypothetical protein